MEKLIFYKRPLFRIFIIQFGEILGFELGLVICYQFIHVSFWLLQLMLVPIFLILMFSQYNKPIISIIFDMEKSVLRMRKISFCCVEKEYVIPFEQVSARVRSKWLLNYYSQVLEIKEKDMLVTVIPIRGSIWTKGELNHIIEALKELAASDKIKADLGSYY
jgi:hypothetical protein